MHALHFEEKIVGLKNQEEKDRQMLRRNKTQRKKEKKMRSRDFKKILYLREKEGDEERKRER